MFPVRCYTCNAISADKHPEYARRVGVGEHPRDVLLALRVERMCCRRMFLSHVDLLVDQLEYGNVDTVLDEGGTVLRRMCTTSHEVSCD